MKPKTALSKRKATKPEVSSRLVNVIIQRVANGESLRAICRDEGMPPRTSVRKRINQSSSLRAQFARACEERAELLCDDLLDISDSTQVGEVVTTGPKGVEVKQADMLGHRQLQVDTRKWLLSKLMPHRFGERVEHTGAGGGAIQVEHGMSAKMLESLTALRSRLPAVSVEGAPAPIDVTPSKG